jgi:CheY-like chemotaxis protein
MDMMMPIMDGWEAVRSLRANLETKDIPILAATALFHNSDLKTCIEQGCNGYINKPSPLWNSRIRSMSLFAIGNGRFDSARLPYNPTWISMFSKPIQYDDYLYSLSTNPDLPSSASRELSINASGFAVLAPGCAAKLSNVCTAAAGTIGNRSQAGKKAW